MASSRRIAAVAVAALTAACSGGAPDLAPAVLSVAPARGYGGAATRITIRGEGFYARASQAGGGGHGQIDARHRAWVDDTELSEVTWVDVRTISALVPAGVGGGLHAVTVENAYGRRARLDAAYEVSADGSPPYLTAQLTLSAAVASEGQAVQVDLVVSNGGGSTALAVAPTLALEGTGRASVLGAAPEPVDVPPGASRSFRWSCGADRAGDLVFRIAARGTDAFTGAPADLPEVTRGLQVVRPGGLAVTVTPARPTVTMGDPVSLTLTVRNTGGAAVLGVQPSVVAAGPIASTTSSPPPPVDLAPGASADFTFEYATSTPGSSTFDAAAAGAEANTLAALAASAARVVVGIQVPPLLTTDVALSVPTASVGQLVTVTATVSNAGGATALQVLPAIAPLAGLSLVQDAGPARDIPGGGSSVFQWTYAAGEPGRGIMTVDAAGQDANSGVAATAPTATTPEMVVEVAAALQGSLALGVSEAVTGQLVTVTFTVRNVGEAAAVDVAAAVTPPSLVDATPISAPPPGPQTIAGSDSHDFVWVYRTSSPGVASFDAVAAGADVHSGAALSTGATAGPLRVDRPASLLLSAAALSTSRSTVGQTVSLSVVVRNLGDAPVRSIAAAVANGGTGSVATLSSPALLDLAGGGSGTLTFAFSALTPGDVSLEVAAAGVDGIAGNPVAALPLPAGTVTVEAPAGLTTALALSATRVSAGQPVTLTAVVTNGGGATVRAAAPVLTAAPGALQARPVPASLDVAGGASASFRWTFDTSAAAGAVGAFRVDCAGADANTGASVVALQATSAVLLVDRPAALTATAGLDLAQATVGQEVQLTVQVTNGGSATARGVGVSIVPPPGIDPTPIAEPAPLQQDIPGGETRTFRWTFRVAASGAGTFAVTVAGADANSGDALGTTASAGPLTMQSRGALVASPTLSRAQVTVGQTAVLSIDVRNTGEATVVGVTPTVTTSGTAGAFLLASPASVDVAGGALVTLEYVYSAASQGFVTFDVTVAGTDANDGVVVAAPSASAGPLAVQTQPGLVTVLALSRLSVSVGQQAVLTADVTNGGTAAAVGVTPALVSVPAGLVLLSGPGPAQDAQGGATVRFQWAFAATSASSGPFAVDCSATDPNTGGPVAAPRATSGVLVVQRPAALAVAVSTDRTRADVGQDVTVTLTVTNTGEATAVEVATTAAGQGAANAAPLSGPGAGLVSLAGGAQRSFAYVFHLAGPPGPATFTATVAGADANSGAALTAAASPAPVVVDAPAGLQVALTATPTTVSLGQVFTVTLRVTNTGGAGALQVAPELPLGQGSANGASALLVAGPSPASPVDVPGGQSATFTWSYAAQAAGALAFDGAASARDANSGAYVASAIATSPGITLQSAAALTASFASIPARVNRNQTFPVTVTIADTGQATATSVLPTVATSAGLTPGTAPGSIASIAGGAASTFQQSFTAGSALGPATVQVDVAGTDANSGNGVTAPRITGTVVVERPSSLTAVLSLPALVGANTDFTVTMTVTNGGDAAAVLVAPSQPSVTASSTSSAAVIAGPLPASASVAGGGGAATFTWTYHAGQVGSLQLMARASGYDANDGGPVSAPDATSGTAVVTEAVLLATDPFGDGTSYADLAAYHGDLWLGPSRSGARLASIHVDGTGLQTTGLALAKDTNSAGVRSSNSYSGAPPYPSLGALGCATNTAGCGPDNESARGLLASASMAGGEWLVAVGAKPSSALNYAYVSSDSAGSTFRYVDLSQQLSGEARTASASAVLAGRLYLGITGKGAASPGLVSVQALPSGSGLDPGGTAYATDLTASKMPSIGASGSPKNSSSLLLVDSLAVFQNRLYLANNGGFMRSTVATPRAYATAAADWAACTPSGAATRTAVAPSQVTDLEPADKAVPAMAAFGGRLFAIRNVFLSGSSGATGGQLWMCTPTTPDAGGGTGCGPTDWTPVVQESSDNAEATLLVATDRYLYLGFNGLGGVRLFRTASAAPAALADFAGMGGCAAGSFGCQGLGGDGFGDASNRRFFGSAALADAQGELRLHLATGDTAAGVPVRIYRIEE